MGTWCIPAGMILISESSQELSALRAHLLPFLSPSGAGPVTGGGLEPGSPEHGCPLLADHRTRALRPVRLPLSTPAPTQASGLTLPAQTHGAVPSQSRSGWEE